MTRNIAIATLAAALFAGTASAETLREALVSTYNSNPTITSQREALKGTDASVAIARSAGRPQASATIGVNRDLTRSGIIRLQNGSDKDILVSGGADLSVPLYQGGTVKNSVKAATTRVESWALRECGGAGSSNEGRGEPSSSASCGVPGEGTGAPGMAVRLIRRAVAARRERRPLT